MSYLSFYVNQKGDKMKYDPTLAFSRSYRVNFMLFRTLKKTKDILYKSTWAESMKHMFTISRFWQDFLEIKSSACSKLSKYWEIVSIYRYFPKKYFSHKLRIWSITCSEVKLNTTLGTGSKILRKESLTHTTSISKWSKENFQMSKEKITLLSWIKKSQIISNCKNLFLTRTNFLTSQILTRSYAWTCKYKILIVSMTSCIKLRVSSSRKT